MLKLDAEDLQRILERKGIRAEVEQDKRNTAEFELVVYAKPVRYRDAGLVFGSLACGNPEAVLTNAHNSHIQRWVDGTTVRGGQIP